MATEVRRGKTLEDKIKNGLKSTRVKNEIFREFMGEFLGTMILIILGDGTVAQTVLSGKIDPSGSKGNFFVINWGYGMAVTMGVLVAGGVSGAHINPAVSLAFALVGKFPFKKLGHYFLGQYLGAIVGAIVVYLGYYEAFQQAGHSIDTIGIFATYPRPGVSYVATIGDQIIGTALLLLLVSAITDPKNMKVSSGLVPFLIGLVVFNIGTSFGWNCGYAVNPARDLGPRIISAAFGWGADAFTSGNHFWVIPILACHVGAIIGVLIYQFGIESHWPREDDDNESETVSIASKNGSLKGDKVGNNEEEMKMLKSGDDTNA